MVEAPVREEAAQQVPPWAGDFAAAQDQATEYKRKVGGDQGEGEGVCHLGKLSQRGAS